MSDKILLDNITNLIHSYVLSKLDLTDKNVIYNSSINSNKSCFEFKKPEFAFIKPTFNIVYSLNNGNIEIQTSSSTGKNNFTFLLPDPNNEKVLLQSIDYNILDKIEYPFDSFNSDGKNNLFDNKPLEIKSYSNPFIGNYYGSNNVNFNNETGNNPFFVDDKSGISGNYVGPNSSIFHGGHINNNFNNKNQQPFIGNFGKNVRYDPIGPMGFGDEPIPDIEKKLFGIGSNLNKKSDLYPEGYSKDNLFK